MSGLGSVWRKVTEGDGGSHTVGLSIAFRRLPLRRKDVVNQCLEFGSECAFLLQCLSPLSRLSVFSP